MLKEFLSQKGISYIDHDVTRDRDAASEVVRLTGQMAVPVIVIDGQTIIGFDRARIEHALHNLKPSLGAAVADAGKITRMKGLPPSDGAYVGGVRAGGLAQRLGLTIGDIILEINGLPVRTADDVETAITRLAPGSQVSMIFARGQQRFTASGTL